MSRLWVKKKAKRVKRMRKREKEKEIERSQRKSHFKCFISLDESLSSLPLPIIQFDPIEFVKFNSSQNLPCHFVWTCASVKFIFKHWSIYPHFNWIESAHFCSHFYSIFPSFFFLSASLNYTSNPVGLSITHFFMESLTTVHEGH